jgi:tetratricopeptide (TPR) repeat protein
MASRPPRRPPADCSSERSTNWGSSPPTSGRQATRAWSRARRCEAALEPLSRAAEGRGHREAWLGIGWCQKRLGRLDLAIAALRKGLAAFPNEALLLYNLACYHSLAGDVPAAVEHLTRAIAIDARFRDLTGAEHDFDAIREDPRFVAVTTVIV